MNPLPLKPRTALSLGGLFCLAAVVVFATCSSFSPVAGTGSQAGNGIVLGKLVDSSGAPVRNARVTLVPADYNAMADGMLPNSSRTTTDPEGRFVFPLVDSGSYNIQSVTLNTEAVSLSPGITVDGDTVPVPDATVESPGTLSIMLPTDGIDYANGYLYIPGTTIAAFVVGSSGSLKMNSVPAGSNLTIQYGVLEKPERRVIRYNVTVEPKKTTVVAMPSWLYEKRLILNTTASGANIASDIYNFPILVRLTASNFDFTKAKPDGADLRFSKSDGTPLHFEIERWDPTSQLAAVWVKVDTICKDDSTQSIMMLYGNSNVSGVSNGAAVFDTTNGFMGVWHLDESTGAKAEDATGNGYDGIPSPSNPTDVNAIYRTSKRFDGASQYFTMPNTANSKLNFPEKGVYCIQAWISVDTPSTSRQAVVSKGNTQYSLEIQDTNWAFSEFIDLTGWEIAQSNWKPFTIVRPETWVLVTGVRSGDREYLYIDDGLCTDTTNLFVKSAKSRLESFDLSIGRIEGAGAAGSCYFCGKIDEVRISTTAPDREWVRLCFRNQNAIDQLIKFQ